MHLECWDDFRKSKLKNRYYVIIRKPFTTNTVSLNILTIKTLCVLFYKLKGSFSLSGLYLAVILILSLSEANVFRNSPMTWNSSCKSPKGTQTTPPATFSHTRKKRVQHISSLTQNLSRLIHTNTEKRIQFRVYYFLSWKVWIVNTV